MTQSPIILSTAYLAPVQYYTKFLLGKELLIEQFEHFPKQTYRNRCDILGANGSLSLVIPVEKGRGGKTNIKDIKIFNELEWQRNHWRSIFSAYNSSPFFEFYENDLYQFYTNKYTFLFDFNQSLFEWISDVLELESKPQLTDHFMGNNKNTQNLTTLISPKNKIPDNNFHPQSYTQVFSDKFGFIPNLSIIDLLFNEGPNSYTILEESIVGENKD